MIASLERQSSKRPACRYYGGKWRLAPWIISHLPPHEHYCEPFAGAASVLLQKPRSCHETINDLDGDVVNFFRTLREQSAELLRAIALTPFSRSDLEAARQPVTDGNSVEQARRFYVRANQSFGGSTAMIRNGWKYNISSAGLSESGRSRHAMEFADIAHLEVIVERLKGVQIECDDALRVISRFDHVTTVFYVDPPYMPTTRYTAWKTGAYRHELDLAGHDFLLDSLTRCAGKVVLGGYASELYYSRLKGWNRVTKQTSKRSRQTAEEVLWIKR